MIEVGSEKQIAFGPFRLDLVNECLWKGAQPIQLRPKAFDLLNYLVERRGELVTKEELLGAVWPETFVGDAVLKVTIGQLREALDDDPKAPRFIETSHRRGYRFIGQATPIARTPGGGHPPIVEHAPLSATLGADCAAHGVVGRDKAFSRLHGWLDRMLAGERQICFVTGEAGIGKTALVDALVRSIPSDRGIRVGRGQCLEQYGTSEAYLPVLGAISRLCREDEAIVDVLRSHAPMWLLQMPSLVNEPDLELLSREVLGATRERMLREMGDALEALTAAVPLVLVLEDLHWSDYSTLDLISYLAGQRQRAHLMVIGTYRPVELIVTGHPLKSVKQELLARQQCEELPLEYLTADAIREYLEARFPRNRFPAELAVRIHDRTEGNPLFMVNAVDYMVEEGLIVETGDLWELPSPAANVEVGVPDSIRQMIEKHVDHLTEDEQRTLEAASVAGAEFSTLAVVAGLDEDRAAVESRFDFLASSRQFVQDCGVQILPNGEAVSRYGFIHALYLSVLYDRVPAARRVQLHRRIGERGEAVYGSRAREIAAELAMHFERGALYDKAARYHQKAADNALRRFAYHEAVKLSRRGLDLLEKLPETPDRIEQELALQLTLGVPLIATEGYAAPAVGKAYMRARELCRHLGDTSDLSEVLWGVWTYHILRAEMETARGIAEEILRLAERLRYPDLAMRGHLSTEITYLHLGEFAKAVEHYEKALAFYDPDRHVDDAFFYALNPGIAMRCFAAWSFWFLGQPDRAAALMQETLGLARAMAEPHGLAHALFFAAVLYQLRREPRTTQEYAEAAIAVSDDHGLVLYQALATIMLGWALLEEGQPAGAIEQIRQGLAAHRATGSEVLRPHFLGLLGEAMGKGGEQAEGLEILDEALQVALSSGDGCYIAELYRLKGELLLMQPKARRASRAASGGKPVSGEKQPAVAEAENCFREAIRFARQQQALSLELRSTTSMARLYREQGRSVDARSLLRDLYECFSEGSDTADVREARALLGELH